MTKFYHENVCCVYSLEIPHLIEAIIMSTINILLFYRKLKRHPYIIPIIHPVLVLSLTLNGSNCQCLEQISVVLKMVEPLKFDCITNGYNIIPGSFCVSLNKLVNTYTYKDFIFHSYLLIIYHQIETNPILFSVRKVNMSQIAQAKH